MSALEIKDLKGKVVGKHELSAALASKEPVQHLLHAAVVTEEANSRQGTQKTKTRSEVRGGGRKPYKQKKTGNARQGSIRSPHYAHGGMALALTPRDYSKKMNRKERRAAIVGAFNAQLAAGNISVADKILFTAAKTKDAVSFLQAHGVSDARRILVIVSQYDEVTYKSFKNLPNVVVRTAPSQEEGAKTVTFSTRDLLVAHKIVVAADALKLMESVWGGDGSVKEKAAKAPKAKKEAAPKAEKAAPAKKAAAPKAEAKAEAAPKAAAKPKAEAKAKAEPKAKAPAKPKAAPKKKEGDK